MMICRPAAARLFALGLFAISQPAQAANGISTSCSAKDQGNSVLVQAKCRAELGPLKADLTYGPVSISKNRTTTVTRTIGGITFKLTIQVNSNSVRVTAVAEAKVLGQTVRMTDSKQVSIN